MKKIAMTNYRLPVIIALCVSMMVGCTKKAEQKTAEQEQTQEVVEVDENRYLDFTALTPEGNELSLSDLVGKTDYVLVDFWASWCGPCRRLIPVLQEIYAGQPKGRLEILSCSVDREEMPWRVALQEENMPWPQMREDDFHPCSDKYGVQFIPHTILIDREGHIVAVNPEEPQIEEILFGE